MTALPFCFIPGHESQVNSNAHSTKISGAHELFSSTHRDKHKHTHTHMYTHTHSHIHTYTRTHARARGRLLCAMVCAECAGICTGARLCSGCRVRAQTLPLLPPIAIAAGEWCFERPHAHTHTHTHTHTYSLTHSLTHSLTPLNMCYSGLLESVSDRDLQELCCPRTRRAVEMGVRPPTRHSLALAVRLCGSVPRPFAVLLAAHKHRLARFALLPALHCMALQGRCW